MLETFNYVCGFVLQSRKQWSNHGMTDRNSFTNGWGLTDGVDCRSRSMHVHMSLGDNERVAFDGVVMYSFGWNSQR